MELWRILAAKVRRSGLNVRRRASEQEVTAFEQECGVTIPSDYRNFLIRVANGGSSPCRLVPLSDWDAGYWCENPQPRMVAEPCIITPDAHALDKRWLDHVPDWEARWERDEWNPTLGTMAIAEMGCGLYYSMIMTGPFRGRIFSYGDRLLNPPYVYPEQSFSEWFENALDACLAGKPVHFLNGRVR